MNQQGAYSRSALQVPIHSAQGSLLLSLAVWSSVVALRPQYLCHQQPLLSLLDWAKWGTHGRKGWGINAKTTQLSGNQPWVEAQSPLWDTEDSVYFLPISWAPKRRFTHTGFPTASTWTRNHQQKWSQTKAKCPDKARPHLRVLGRGHNSQPLLPSQENRLGEHTPALWGHPTYTQASRDLTSQREALMTWGGGLCVSGPGRNFRFLLSTLRALGMRKPVLPTCSPHGGAHRGQGAGNSLPVLF